MQALYAYFKHDGESSLKKSEKELDFSINKSYDLYHYLFLIPLELADYAQGRIDLARQKRIPTFDDLHPNTRFCDNKVIEQLRNNSDLLKYLETCKLSWKNNPELIKELYHQMISSESYNKYMNDPENSYKSDRNYLEIIFKEIVSSSESLYQVLEEQSIYWNDEGEFIITANIKTLSRFKQSNPEGGSLLPLFKNDEDKDFPKKLLRKVVLNHQEYGELISKYSKNWDVERIAFMDILLMQMAIAESIEFVSIPVKVTLNEYLELAKYYSTSRSNKFLNGILDKIFEHLRETNKIVKQGRGLIGDE